MLLCHSVAVSRVTHRHSKALAPSLLRSERVRLWHGVDAPTHAPALLHMDTCIHVSPCVDGGGRHPNRARVLHDSCSSAQPRPKTGSVTNHGGTVATKWAGCVAPWHTGSRRVAAVLPGLGSSRITVSP